MSCSFTKNASIQRQKSINFWNSTFVNIHFKNICRSLETVMLWYNFWILFLKSWNVWPYLFHFYKTFIFCPFWDVYWNLFSSLSLTPVFINYLDFFFLINSKLLISSFVIKLYFISHSLLKNYFISHDTRVLSFEKSASKVPFPISKSPGKTLLLMETILTTSYCLLCKPPQPIVA